MASPSPSDAPDADDAAPRTSDQSTMREWWDGLTEDQREVLRRGNEQFPMESEATTLLIDTNCPALPTGSTLEPTPGLSLPMPSEVAELINGE